MSLVFKFTAYAATSAATWAGGTLYAIAQAATESQTLTGSTLVPLGVVGGLFAAAIVTTVKAVRLFDGIVRRVARLERIVKKLCEESKKVDWTDD